MFSSIRSQVSWYHCLQVPLHKVILSFWLSGIWQWQWMSKVSSLTGREIGLRYLKGNWSICPFSRQLRKYALICPWSNVQAVGSVLVHSAVAKAKANRPQSDPPYWCCTFMYCRVTESAGIQNCSNFLLIAINRVLRCTVIDVDYSRLASDGRYSKPVIIWFIQDLNKLTRFDVHRQGMWLGDIL